MNKNDFAENDALLAAAAQGDLNARNALVTNNMGLVYSVVRRFGGRGVESEDLIQIGARSDTCGGKIRYELWSEIFHLCHSDDNRRNQKVYA